MVVVAPDVVDELPLVVAVAFVESLPLGAPGDGEAESSEEHERAPA